MLRNTANVRKTIFDAAVFGLLVCSMEEGKRKKKMESWKWRGQHRNCGKQNIPWKGVAEIPFCGVRRN